MIRLLTAADAPAIQAIVQSAYGAPIDATRLFDVPPLPSRAIVVGDPAVPALCKLLYYVMDARQIALMPNGLRQAIAATNGRCIQVSDFYPLSASQPAVTAQLLPHLATVLKAIVTKAPANLQATIAATPVWAAFDNSTDAEAGQLVSQFLLVFPNAGHAGRYIWHTKLSDARDAVAASAVNV